MTVSVLKRRVERERSLSRLAALMVTVAMEGARRERVRGIVRMPPVKGKQEMKERSVKLLPLATRGL